MTCIQHLRAARTAAAAATVAVALVATTAGASHVRAQNPTPPPPPPTPTQPGPVVPVPAAPLPAIVAYRAPALALVQPPPGALSVPQDRPVVVFRFAQGEPTDPIDAASFRVAVDGHDRTARFQVTVAGAAGEAWGPLADAGASAGAHQVSARVCSSRGACGTADVTVTSVPAAAAVAAPDAERPNGGAPARRARMIARVVNAARRLLMP